MQKYYTLGPTKSEQTGYLLCYGSIILIFLYMKTIYSTFFTGFLYLWVLGAAGQSSIGVGQAVYRTPLNKFGLMDIPLSTFQPGLYLVSLVVNDTILSTEKLIVQPQDARP